MCVQYSCNISCFSSTLSVDVLCCQGAVTGVLSENICSGGFNRGVVLFNTRETKIPPELLVITL